MKKRLIALLLAFIISHTIFASGQSENVHLRMATTTSTDNSGLLNLLLPVFEKDSRYKVDVIAVGTGKAITLGENGDVDVILVHARSQEDAFVDGGFGINRKDVMFNDFVILGPESDPAGIKGMKDGATALKKIRESGSDFLSRGDNSGTHTKEKAFWSVTEPAGTWYKETGQGMGTVLTMTSEVQGYTLTDRGTYLSMKDKLDLKVLVEGDPELFNPYGVIAVNPKLHENINLKGAMAFIDFITSPKGQDLINSYKVNGNQLFFGNAVQ
ncbi:MAG: substrate-binding domain-containing protein [Spirochaetaceae bacterium]|jgi:tungstate transport system substrate-binding protein|nr:substrate-binding domain-containing protein [Spirochaetaceae bacterium]